MAEASSLPPFARELAGIYKSGAVNTFIIGGNIADLVPARDDRGLQFLSLKEFLIRSIFGERDIVVFYDQSSGIQFAKPDMRTDFERVVKAVDTVQGTRLAESFPKDPARALALIERYLRTRLLDRATKRLRAAVIIDYAHFVAPASMGYNFTQDEASALITLNRWPSDREFLDADITFVLITENLMDLHPLLVRSPYTSKVTIPLPDGAEREEYLRTVISAGELAELSPLDHSTIAKHTSGLSRVNLNQVLAQARRRLTEGPRSAARPLDLEGLYDAKKQLIEKECYGLLEFIRPKYLLEHVSGHEAAKQWLKEDSDLLRKGKLDALPMGYLVCGPVGTGKTFLITCYAGSLGIPCVKLLNFRSQWQGVTEGNWEKILNTLKAVGPVGIIIDEADAAIGNRDQSGDSGTSSRVFSMLASQMGDTSYRGVLLWFLLTCRPDLLPIDLKRQGRAEVHIPLFYPATPEERAKYFSILAKKNGATLKAEDVSQKALSLQLSGADIEGLVIRAKRLAELAGSDSIQKEHLARALEGFVPPSYPEEIELQVLAAVAECTHKDFLPPQYRDMDRSQVSRKLRDLKTRLD